MNKRDFGSFHSSNVQELLRIPKTEYVPPPFPFELPCFDEYKDKGIEFGKNTKQKHFYIEDEITFLNHGAFGCVLSEALDAAQKWQIYTERQPLRFFDRELLPHLVHVTRRLAEFVGCDAEDLVLVENATTALNCVLRSIKFEADDRIYSLSVTYGAVKKILKFVSEQTGAVLQEEVVHFPVSSKQQIIELVASTLTSGTRLAVFDHIPSNAPIILPIKEIIEICHERKVPVLIDGAHALGALPLHLCDLQPDYYISNAHKWFCSPKGSAFMFVKKELQAQTRPLIISHGFGSGFNSEFVWAGMHDYSPFLAMHTLIDFWTSVGPDKIRKYIYDLVRQAANHLVEAWNTRLAAPIEMFGCEYLELNDQWRGLPGCPRGPMALVQLPKDLFKHKENVDYSAAEDLQNRLYHDFNIEVPVKVIQGHLYVRVSGHIHNEIGDYLKLSHAVQQMTDATRGSLKKLVINTDVEHIENSYSISK